MSSTAIHVRLPDELLAALDADRALQDYPVSRNTQITALLWWAVQERQKGRKS